MTQPASRASGAPAGEIVITRVFDAPRELLWRAWTDPEHLKRWWGPHGFTTPHFTVDLRPGGRLHFCMRSPEGQEIWARGVYQEIVEPERLVFTDSFSDPEGNIVPATHYGLDPDWPTEALVTVALVEQAGKTTLTLRHAVGSASAAMREGTQQGWSESFERLAEHVAR